MNKQKLGATLIVAMIVTTGWNLNQNDPKEGMSEFALENVEALASGEGPSGNVQSNKVITDEIKSMEVLERGIRTTFYRHCSYGGSDNCASGTWVEFTPLH